MSNVVDVAKNLTEIERLTERLAEQAVHQASARIDGTGMPGGLAMVAMAPVANQEAWEAQYEARERLGRDHSHVADEDDDWVPILQTLCFWSEQWRAEHGTEYDRRPTIASEAAFIRWALNWAWDNELHFDDFAKDIADAVRRLEDVLHAGERVERGVPCMYDECGGRRLIRFVDHKGDRSDWKCRTCNRTWTEDQYAAMVTAANEAAQVEIIETETWCSVERAARDVSRSVKTIRTWVNRGEVASVCIVAGKRARFVSLDEVREKDERAKSRRRAA